MLPAQRIELPGADITYTRQWLDSTAASAAFEQLLVEVPYSQHRVRMFGRELPSPRLSAWIGDPHASYVYSRVRHEPLPWTPTLVQIRARLLDELGVSFNSVLVNRYRNEQDSMGWHSDDEPELGNAPLIASVSLGAGRQLRFRSRIAGGPRASVDLENGSLLLMGGGTQNNYLHAMMKSRRPITERINLTFRSILVIRPLPA